jgi:hypothetical protein
MKKVKLTKMELTQMSIGKRELLSLRGGRQMTNANEDTSCDCVVNRNSTDGCECIYKNTAFSSNDNGVNGCVCTCI